MKTVDSIIKEASLLGACSKSNGISNWKSLSWIFFTPQGVEFCEKHNFPDLSIFREMSSEIANHGVYVDAGGLKIENKANVALIGKTSAEMTCSGVEHVHKIILMHGAKAKINASNHAVLLIVNIGGCEVEIEKDETVVIL